MPVREYGCRACRSVVERFEHRYDSVPPDCCGGPMAMLVSTFATPFCRPMREYNDPKKEYANNEGHWAYRVRSSRTGVPERVYIDSFAKQREFCREEGLTNPGDINPNAQINDDGHKLHTVGMPGAWV